MTDNEKRAHDFAVSILPKMFDLRVNEAQNCGNTSIEIDMYTEYFQVYTKVLESFNRDFSGGK